MYKILRNTCVIRNEKDCSYLVNINRANYDNPFSFESLTIPPFMGYILSEIGKYPYQESCEKISIALNVSLEAIESFLLQLINAKEHIRFKISDDLAIILPPNLLEESNKPDSKRHITSEDFDPKGEFKIKRPLIPFSANLMVTTACTTDCIYCYADRSISPILTTQEVLEIIDNLYESGVVNVTITGGDLMRREDWPIIMKRIIELNYNPFISTKTPLDKNGIDLLKFLNYKEIQFSLDSCDPGILKKMVNVDKEYFDKIRQMLEYSSTQGLGIKIRTVITKLNGSKEQFDKLFNFLSQYECIKGWDLTPVFFSEHKKNRTTELKPENEDLKYIYNFAYSFNGKFKIHIDRVKEDGYKVKRCQTTNEFVKCNQTCLANVSTISILANGKCTVCEMLYNNPTYILGDIKQQTLKEIWNSEKALNFYYPEQKNFPKDSPCSSCGEFKECRLNYGKKVCFSDIGKMKLRPEDPDSRCPMAKDTDLLL